MQIRCKLPFQNAGHLLNTGQKMENRVFDVKELLTEFDKALEDEIKAVKTRGGNIRLALRDGRFVREMAGGRVYQFDLERKIPVMDETPAQIEIMGRDYRATVVRFLEFKLEVRIMNFEGEKIPFAFLKIDATYVLRKLKEALSSLSFGAQELDIALKAFNYITPKCSIGEVVFTLIDTDGNGSDPFQSQAIKICLGNEVAFTHGPPGTGKTRTLVNVVNDLAYRGKKILVSCHTNIACDNVIEHFIRYNHEKTVEDLLNNGQIVRIGTPVLNDERVNALTIEAIHERLSVELQKEKEESIDLLDILTGKNDTYYEYKQLYMECEELRSKIINCRENIAKSKDIVNQFSTEEKRLGQTILDKNQLLSIAERRNPVINFFRGTMPKHIRLAIANLNIEKTGRARNRREEEKRLRLLSDELDKLTTLLTEKSNRIPRNIDIERIENILWGTTNALEDIGADIVDIDDRISRLNEGVLNNAKIAVSTLAKTFTDPILMNMHFDVVVIDEASIAPLPMLFYVCSLAKEKVLIFGDPKQLGPIKLADTVAAKRWLGKDIFQQADATEGHSDDLRIQSLDNQYRMHRGIYEIVNSRFYRGKLHDRRPGTDREYDKYNNLIPKPEYRVVIVDTSNASACMGTEKVGTRSRSRYNLYHIQVIEKILQDLIDGNNIRQEDIGIITPYRSQASFIREALSELELNLIDVGVVHSFQGIERKYIIFDIVEAPFGRKVGVLVDDKHSRYLGKDMSENTALRLLTVAFSRPKEKLLIISHNKHMLKELPANSTIRCIIDDLVKIGAVEDGSIRVPYYIPRDEFSDATLSIFSEEELLGKEAVFNQKSFYPNLIRDLESAKKEVILISGYMTANRLEKLMPHFADLLSKGVNIKIVTRPPREQRSREHELEELHHRLGSMGIEIYQHYGTHEKVVAIDGRILYAGSLNVLSFNHRSYEMMTRTDSRARLQKVFSVILKDRPQLRDVLSQTGYITSGEVTDLTPEKSQNIIEDVRPNRKVPKSKQEAEGYYRSMFKELRKKIAVDKRIPYMAIFHNKTIEAMLNDPPTTVEQLLSLPEFRRNRTNIGGYEDIVLKILREYGGLLAGTNRP